MITCSINSLKYGMLATGSPKSRIERRLGFGYDSQITSETYNRRQMYHQHINEYLIEKNEENPDFIHQLNMPIYQLEELLVSFCDKLYDRKCAQ